MLQQDGAQNATRERMEVLVKYSGKAIAIAALTKAIDHVVTDQVARPLNSALIFIIGRLRELPSPFEIGSSTYLPEILLPQLAIQFSGTVFASSSQTNLYKNE